jgi:hypothetical protein
MPRPPPAPIPFVFELVVRFFSYYSMYIMSKRSASQTVPPMSMHESSLYDISVPDLRTLCNRRKGQSCRGVDGKYLPKKDLIALIMMAPDIAAPALPPRNKKVTDFYNYPAPKLEKVTDFYGIH